MEKKLLIVIPSRSRPKSLIRIHDAIERTVTTDPTVVVCLDEDDAWQYPVYPEWGYLIEPRMKLSPWINFAVSKYRDTHTHMILLGDDVVPETVGWDRMLLDALGDLKFGVAYGDDGIQHERLPTHAVIPLGMYDTLGWIAYPKIKHLYLDNIWLMLADSTGTLRYVPEAKLTHLHRNMGLSPDDEVYRESNNSPQIDEDYAAYAEWCQSPQLIEDIEAIKRLLQ